MFNITNSLEGKVVLVTGGGSGLGEATARAFACAGAHVAVVDLNGANAERVSHDLQGEGHASYQCDVSDADSVFAKLKTLKTNKDE